MTGLLNKVSWTVHTAMIFSSGLSLIECPLQMCTEARVKASQTHRRRGVLAPDLSWAGASLPRWWGEGREQRQQLHTVQDVWDEQQAEVQEERRGVMNGKGLRNITPSDVHTLGFQQGLRSFKIFMGKGEKNARLKSGTGFFFSFSFF